MKRKQRYVKPKINRAVELCPESNVLQAHSTDDLTQFTSIGQEVFEYDASGSSESGYTIDLY